MKKLLPLVFVFALLPEFAFAHATPLLYKPASSSLLTESPANVAIRFSERVEPAASSIQVFASDGTRIDDGEAVVSKEDPYELSVQLKESENGTATVSWQVVSKDDGHFTKGAYVFSVGKETEGVSAPDFQVIHRSALPEAFAIFFELLGGAMLFGLLVISMYFEPSRPSMKRFSFFGIIGSALAILGALLYVALQSRVLGGINISLATTAGSFSLYRAVLSGAFLVIFLLTKHSVLHGKKASALLLFLLLVASAVLRAIVSHAAASHFLPMFSVAVNFAHLLSKDLLAGTLVAFLYLLLPTLRTCDRETRASLLSRLCIVVAIAIFIGGITGAYVTWLHIKAFSNIFLTEWGAGFLALLAAAIVLLCLRFFNTKGQGVYLIFEATFAVAILFFSSALIITTPPLRGSDVFSASSVRTEGRIGISEDRFDDAVLLVSFSDTNISRGVATLTNAEKRVGPIVEELIRRSPGVYSLPKADLNPAGQWTIDIAAQRQNALDLNASFKIEVPNDFEVNDDTRSFDGFAILCIILGALAAFLSLILLHRGLRTVAHKDEHGAFLPGSALATVCIGAVFAFIIQVAFSAHGGVFANLCRQSGGLWHESIPVREGRALTDFSALGCMIGSGRGQYHFVDLAEFKEFMKPTGAQASLKMAPAVPRTGFPTIFTFTLTDLGGKPLSDLRINHDRILHAIIVGQDLKTFAHIHPEDFKPVTKGSNELQFRYQFPAAGRYTIAIDYSVRAQTFLQEFYVNVTGSPALGTAMPQTGNVQTVDGYEVTLKTPTLVAGKTPQKISFRVTKDGSSVTDMKPYLAAPMHIAVIKNDLRRVMHTHGEIPQTLWQKMTMPRDPTLPHNHVMLTDTFGPKIEAYVQFPSPGEYQLFGEFMAGGSVHRVEFAMTVN